MNKSNTVQAFWVMLSSLSSMALALVSAAILSRYMEKAEYGTYKQVIYVYSSLLVIFSAGLPNIFSYFLPKITLEQGKELVNKISWLLIGLGSLFSLFLFVFSGYIASFMGNPAMVEGLRWFAIIPIFLLPTLGIDGIFASYQQTHLMPIYNTLIRLVMLACIVLPVIYIENSSVMAIKGWIVASAFSLILAMFYKSLPFRKVNKASSNIKLNELFKYSIPLVTASIWGILLRYSDQFYISRYFGSEVYAEFSNGYIEIPLVGIVTSSVAVVIMPYFSRLAVDKNNLFEIAEVYKRTLLKSAYIIYPIVVYFIVFGKEIVTFIFSKNYEASGVYFQINMLVNFFNIVIFAPIFLAFGKTKLYSNIHFGLAIASWVAGYIVVEVFKSPIAIAISSTAITITMVLIGLFYLQDFLKMKLTYFIPFKKLVYIFLHSIGCIVAVYFIILLIGDSISIFFVLVISSILYGSILIFSSKFFNLEYLRFLMPFYSRILNRFNFR